MDVDCDLFSAKYYLVWRPKIWRIVQGKEAHWILFTDFDRKIFLNLNNSAPMELCKINHFLTKNPLNWQIREKKGDSLLSSITRIKTGANIQSQIKG